MIERRTLTDSLLVFAFFLSLIAGMKVVTEDWATNSIVSFVAIAILGIVSRRAATQICDDFGRRSSATQSSSDIATDFGKAISRASRALPALTFMVAQKNWEGKTERQQLPGALIHDTIPGIAILFTGTYILVLSGLTPQRSTGLFGQVLASSSGQVALIAVLHVFSFSSLTLWQIRQHKF